MRFRGFFHAGGGAPRVWRGIAAIGLSLAATQVAAHDFNLDLLLGGNTNPNRLADSFEVDSAYAAAAAFKFSHESEASGYFYQLGAEGNRFSEDEDAPSDPRFAEVNRGFAQIGLKWAPERKHGRADFRIEANARSIDQVFVYPPTGGVGVARNNFGVDIVVDDRFDSDSAELRAGMEVPMSAEAKFLFSVAGQERNYQDYVDLPNLDYQQLEAELGFDKMIWPRTSLRTMIGGGRREYKERFARDEDGEFIADSNLEYRLFEIENTLTYHISNRWNWNIGFHLDQRKDNEDGYHDMKDGRAFMGFGYTNRDIIDFNLSFAYVKREFDNTDDNAALAYEEEIVERSGGQVKAEFMRNLNYGGWRTLDLLVGLSYETFEHDDEFFTYDQGQFYLGLRWRPY